MLTLIGTLTNLPASNISANLLNHPCSMFEFTLLGFIVLLTRSIYLMTIGYRLLPDRVTHERDYIRKYNGKEYLKFVEIVVSPGSSLIGETLKSSTFQQRYNATVLAFRGRGKTIHDRLNETEIRAGDSLLL
ncbi:MAG: K+/H+ antiporter YhaU, regulatory subunit KhtT [Candidatus Methanohalarchaeum thermophilum]|uniref:K+/H+ antiporter YhaU, regulatory subunit KhtT n=1 Tax=Methanohalarchaeum thermophilum TaxID=1903181 RepID=A0A1Q6DVW0_METT1|nr:MAG: K+/H+ antiporter YhaU, regulatory subunit KhtT [Candidatus Methanohalarchaeum thermophilum]